MFSSCLYWLIWKPWNFCAAIASGWESLVGGGGGADALSNGATYTRVEFGSVFIFVVYSHKTSAMECCAGRLKILLRQVNRDGLKWVSWPLVTT